MTRYGINFLRNTLRQLKDQEGLRPLSTRTGIPVGKIRSLLEGRAALSTTIESACEALDLEFYVGPPRRPIDKPSDSDSKTRGRSPGWVESLRSEIRGLADETRDLFEGRVSSRQVEVRELGAAAGGGAMDLDETVTGYVAFRRDWLNRVTDDPTRCTVISVTGDSMEPTLPDGSSILVDRGQQTRKEGRIYVVTTDEGLIVKRSIRARGAWWLRSDNRVYQDRPWPKDPDVIGEVRWVGRTL